MVTLVVGSQRLRCSARIDPPGGMDARSGGIGQEANAPPAPDGGEPAMHHGDAGD